MGVSGSKKERTEFKESKKWIGLVECKVVAVNPDEEQYVELTGNTVKEGSKQFDYLGTDDEGNKQLRVDFWMQDVKDEEKIFKTSYFLKNVVRTNKDGSKKEYINQIGNTSWAESVNSLNADFKKTDYRECHEGESDMYGFLRVWISQLDYKDADAVLDVEWNKLMKGNVKELRNLIDCEYSSNILVPVGIKTTEKTMEDGTTKLVTYQSVYKKITYPGMLEKLISRDYDKEHIYKDVITRRINKERLKPHEYFVADIKGEYGWKDLHALKKLKEYNEDDNIVTTEATISEDDNDY